MRVDLRTPPSHPVKEMVEFARRCEEAGLYACGFNDSQLYQRLRANGVRASAGMNWENLLAKEFDLISKRHAEVTGSRSTKSVYKKPLSEPRP